MAATYFGPEDPRPLSVISESHRDELRDQLPELSPWDRYSLGEEYEQQLFTLLHQHLELGTTDTLCYVGDTRDFFVDRLEEHFCLVNPVQTVVPGLVLYEETKDHTMVPFSVTTHSGPEEFFRLQVQQQERKGGSQPPLKFDKILVHDACRNVSHPGTNLYAHMMRCLNPGGILLILHRPARLSTLPIFRKAQNRLADDDTPHTDILRALHALPHTDVHWELQSVPVTIERRKWLAMLRDRYPPHLQLMTTTEVLSGLRELSEGVLKYEGDLVEFNDRLLFVRVTQQEKLKSSGSHPPASSQRQSCLTHTPVSRDLKLTMTLPHDPQPSSSGSRPRAHDSGFKFMWD